MRFFQIPSVSQSTRRANSISVVYVEILHCFVRFYVLNYPTVLVFVNLT